MPLDGIESFAKEAARSFVVGAGRPVNFDPNVAKKLLKDASKSKEET